MMLVHRRPVAGGLGVGLAGARFDVQQETEAPDAIRQDKQFDASIFTQVWHEILIIGSLYWNSGRQTWRKSRLLMDQALTVRAPIRYGRRSVGCGNTYTMVFSRQCELGQAKVVPCRSTAGDIVDEAEHLWAAERNEPPNHRISASWGRVALLSRSDRNIPQGILNTWAARVSREPSPSACGTFP